MIQRMFEEHPWRTTLTLALAMCFVAMMASDPSWAESSTAAIENSLTTFYCSAVGLIKGILGKILGLGAIGGGAALWLTGSRGAAVPVFGVAGALLLGPLVLDAMFTGGAC